MESQITITRPDIDFLITNRCPNQCRHCVFCSGQQLPDEMSTAEVVTSLQNIKNALHVEWISISGGEPFSRRDFCNIYIEASKLFNITLISTGIGADEHIFQLLAEHPPRQAIVSLYGLRDYHNEFCQAENAFESTIRYLKYLKQLRHHSGIIVSVNVVCHRGNINAVPEIMDYLSASDLTDEVKILALSPVGRGQHIIHECLGGLEWIALIKHLKEYTKKGDIRFNKGIRIEKHIEDSASSEKHISQCYIINDKGKIFSSCIHIDADGEIYPCTMLVRQQAFSLGNIRYPEKIDHQKCKSLIKQTHIQIMQENCAGCKTQVQCLGGCFGYHLVNKTDYRCNEERIRFGCPDRYELLDADQ